MNCLVKTLLIWLIEWVKAEVDKSQAASKTKRHIYIQYSVYIVELWTALSSWFSNHIDLSNDFEHLSCTVIKDDFSPQIKFLWLAGITTTCWEIWQTRNKRVFEDKKPNINSSKA